MEQIEILHRIGHRLGVLPAKMPDKTTKLARAIRAVLRVLFVVFNNLYCIPTHAVWMMILLPIKYLIPDTYWKMEGLMYKWLLQMVAYWGWTAGYRFVEYGDSITECYDSECLVLSNHQSTGDVPSFMSVFQPKGSVVPDMMWIMDRLFKYTNFGLVSAIHGDFFIQSGKETRDGELLRLKRHMRDVYCRRKRKWIILFPEGGFLTKRKATSQKYAAKMSLPNLEHVTIPRVGAMQAIIDTLHPANVKSPSPTESPELSKSCSKSPLTLKYIIDVTIGYPQHRPVDLPHDIISMLGQPCRVHLFYRLYPIAEVPTDPEALTLWLYNRFFEKEKLLAEFYKTGSFPKPRSTVQATMAESQANRRATPIHKLSSEVFGHGAPLQHPIEIVFDNHVMVIQHLLFIASSLFHWYVLCYVWSLVL